MTVVPVILSGGAGSRLWPLSRESLPKQFLSLGGSHSLVQETALRVSGAGFAAPLVVAAADHRFMVAEQLAQVGITPRAVVLEPMGRNTAPAIAAAALMLVAEQADAVMLILPADHVIRDVAAFHQAVERGLDAVKRNKLVLFGIRPDHAATGYGYIHMGQPLPSLAGVFGVSAFVEKPDRQSAAAYLEAGDYVWNSGMFLMSAAQVIDELARHAPEVLAGARAALAKASRDPDFVRLDAEGFGRCPSISIDYAVMESTDQAAVAPAEMGWTDVGAWSAVWGLGEPGADGNVVRGDVAQVGSRNSYLHSDGPLVAAVGVDDLVVVATADAVLVAHRSADQHVKPLLDLLKSKGHPAATGHVRCYRPWGWYETIDAGERFQVKRITVNPGQKLSLQKHLHRSEHWVVVSGSAMVTVGETRQLMRENESVYIPVGEVHRLENPGKLPLSLIEVQTGVYLGEDDIIRLEDDYAREAKPEPSAALARASEA